MSFFLEELKKTTKIRSFVKYNDLPSPLKDSINQLFDEGFCETLSRLDADGNEDGSFKLGRLYT